MKIMPIILAGGSGSRLWPLSREIFPKQFLSLHGDRSLLQETLLRLDGLPIINPMVICNEEHRFVAAEQLRQINRLAGNILLEPIGRNTAPAVALAALTATLKGDEPILLVLAADHAIEKVNGFQQAIKSAIVHAKNDKLVTFGIAPHRPETGYGYIQKGESIGDDGFSVNHFIEKPDLETAEQYIASGNYFWNSGLFMFKASRYLQELATYRPDIIAACRLALDTINTDVDFLRINQDAFLQCPEASIDYAVMEQTRNAVMVEMDAGWDDIGSWSALWNIATKDLHSNAVHGDVILEDVKNSYLHSENLLITAVGIDNLVIIQSRDAILVSHKDRVQDVKKIVTNLKQAKRSEYRQHREIYRPWGKYDLVDIGSRHQVKRIRVKPGAKLSLQLHHHRAEHWIVVSGTAKVTNGKKTFLVHENESTYIPIGVVHTLENPEKTDLELIEVQSGNYLSEDDIVRFEDNYGRAI